MYTHFMNCESECLDDCIDGLISKKTWFKIGDTIKHGALEQKSVHINFVCLGNMLFVTAHTFWSGNTVSGPNC